jgi:cell pole-organizing protein PopZ
MDKVGPVDEPTIDEMRASLRRMISDREVESGALSAFEPRMLSGESAADAAELFFDEEPEPGVEPTGQALVKVIELAIAEAMQGVDAEVRADATAAATPQGMDELARPPASGMPSEAPTATEPAPADELSRRLLEERWGPPLPLLSPHTDAMVNSAFNQLATSMLRSGSARSVDGFVEDMLRPMLRSWLDVKLPPLVEKLVREEIERVSRRCRQ